METGVDRLSHSAMLLELEQKQFPSRKFLKSYKKTLLTPSLQGLRLEGMKTKKIPEFAERCTYDEDKDFWIIQR